MGWCPNCVWNRLRPEVQEALASLQTPEGPKPQRILGPIRSILANEELVELDHLDATGAYWRASARGRAVIRAGENLKDEADDDDE